MKDPTLTEWQLAINGLLGLLSGVLMLLDVARRSDRWEGVVVILLLAYISGVIVLLVTYED